MRKWNFSWTGVALCLIFTLPLYQSCQKGDTTRLNGGFTQPETSFVNRWLDGLGQPSHPGRAEWLSSLKEALNLDGSYQEKTKNGELVIVPLNRNFKSTFNKDGDKTAFLVLNLENNRVKRSNIVLFKPASPAIALTATDLAKLISEGELNRDGEYTMLGLWDKFRFSAVVKDRQIHSVSTYEVLKDKPTTASRSGQCTGWYLVTRYYDSKGNLVHTDEVLIFIECDDSGGCPPGDPYCTDASDSSDPNNPGGGSGGSSESDVCTTNFSAFDFNPCAEKISVTICGTGPNTRTKCYLWKIYKVSNGLIPMYFTSKEVGVQSFNGTSWQFKSFVHSNIAKSGFEILYNASIENLSAVPSLKKSRMITYYDIAEMQLSFSVKISAICKGMPIAYNHNTSTNCAWHVNE